MKTLKFELNKMENMGTELVYLDGRPFLDLYLGDIGTELATSLGTILKENYSNKVEITEKTIDLKNEKELQELVNTFKSKDTLVEIDDNEPIKISTIRYVLTDRLNEGVLVTFNDILIDNTKYPNEKNHLQDLFIDKLVTILNSLGIDSVHEKHTEQVK